MNSNMQELSLYTKKGDSNYEGNYRPISILPVISKILEKSVYTQLYTYLKNHSLLYENQSGFRTGYSTDTALIYLSDLIRTNMDQGLITGMILLDLQKAFDTVNHQILLDKLKCIGATQNCTNWFDSYLTNRNQQVDLGGNMSEPLTITCGVPQGSILGPLLFLLYVNDMSLATQEKLMLYADDSGIIVSGKSILDIEKTLS